MSVCGPGGQTEEDSGSEEVTTSGAAVREIYKQKPTSKVVRVLTVLAYLLSVSLAAILLSVYYVCVWKSPELPPLNDTGDGDAGALTVISARRAEATHYFDQQHTYSGRGDSAIESIGEIGTEDSNTTSTGTEMEPDGESGNMDTSENTTNYDSTTVHYTETPSLSNETDTGT